MSPGAVVQIKPDWRPAYTTRGPISTGVVEAVSPSGAIVRVRFDRATDLHIPVCHLHGLSR